MVTRYYAKVYGVIFDFATVGEVHDAIEKYENTHCQNRRLMSYVINEYGEIEE